jgi:hypothetical protein
MTPVTIAALICIIGCCLHFLAGLKPDPVATLVELGKALMWAGAIAGALLLTTGGAHP